MNLQYEIKTTPIFEKQFKKLIKKYKSLKEELAGIIMRSDTEIKMQAFQVLFQSLGS